MSSATLTTPTDAFDETRYERVGEFLHVSRETANANPVNTMGEFPIPDTEAEAAVVAPAAKNMIVMNPITYKGHMEAAAQSLEAIRQAEEARILDVARASGAVTNVRLEYYNSPANQG